MSLAALKKKFDYLFSIVNNEILPLEIINSPSQFAINYHDSLLPSYSGVHSTSWAILNNEKKHGVSWHIIDTGLDTGPILKQAEIPILPTETSFSLNLKCYEKALQLFSDLIDELPTHSFKTNKQNLSLRTYFSRYLKPAGDGFIDWYQPAEVIKRYCLALNFGSYNNTFAVAKVIFNHHLFIVPSVTLTECVSEQPPGTIINIDKQGIRVATGSVDIIIPKLQFILEKNYSINQLIKTFHIHEKGMFTLFAFEELKAIKELGEQIAKYETVWCQQLLKIQDFPQLPSIPKFQEPGVYQLEIPIKALGKLKCLSDIPIFSQQYFANSELLLVIWLIYLRLINPFLEKGYTLGYKVQKENLFNEYLVEYVPLTINLTLDTTIHDAFLHIFSCLSQINKHVSFKKDIYARYSSLFQSYEKWPLENLPIAIIITESLNDYVLDPSISIAIVLNQTGDQCKIIHSVGNNNSEKILWLEQIAEHVSSIISKIFSLNQDELAKTTLSHLPVLTKNESQMLMDWSSIFSKKCFFPENISLNKLFEEQSSQQPHSPSVTFNETTLSYLELNAKANQLAHYLQKQGVRIETKIAICLDPGIDFIVAALAILKCHAIYVPISTNNPVSRIKKLIMNSEVTGIVTDQGKKSIFHNKHGKIFILCLDQAKDKLEEESVLNLSSLPYVKNACVIYTSGSTGNPKGVVISHLAIISRIKDTNYVSFDKTDKIAQIANLAFDAALFEIWEP